MTKLSRNGYIIKKSDYTLKEIKDIKTDLTVKPFSYGDIRNGPDKKFNIYLESPNKLYLPRFYGISKFGKSKENWFSPLVNLLKSTSSGSNTDKSVFCSTPSYSKS